MQSGKMIIVANVDDNAISTIDPQTKQIRQKIKVVFKPHEVCVSPDYQHVLVSNYGDLEWAGWKRFFNFFARPAAGHNLSIMKIQGQTLIAEGSIDLGPNARPHGILCLSNSEALVTAQGIKALLRADYINKKIIGKIDLPYDGAHMFATDTKKEFAFVACFSGWVSKIDLKTYTVLQSAHIGITAESVALTPDNKYLFATNSDGNTVTVLNPADLSLIKHISTDFQPTRTVPFNEGRSVAVVNSGWGTIQIIDVATLTLLDKKLKTTSPADEGCYAKLMPVPVTLHMVDERMGYVTNMWAGTISHVDLVDLKILDTFKAGLTPDGLDVYPVAVATKGM